MFFLKGVWSRFSVVALVAGGLAACGSDSSEDSASTDDSVNLSPELTDASERGVSSTDVSSAKLTMEVFVQEDPTLDVSKDTGANADSVAAQATTALAGCASAKVTHASGTATVAVDFGENCTIQGVTFAGQASATIAAGSGQVSVSFTFTSLSVSGHTLSGSATATTSNATTFTTTADLTSGTRHVTFQGSASTDPSGVLINGSGTLQSGSSAALPFTIDAVHRTRGACYADAGSITTTKTATTHSGKSRQVKQVIAFDANTPSTGQVTVTVESVSSKATLPAYGSCPHP